MQFDVMQVPDAERQSFVLHQVSPPTINRNIRLFLEHRRYIFVCAVRHS
jgi:hypothetical protein